MSTETKPMSITDRIIAYLAARGETRTWRIARDLELDPKEVMEACEKSDRIERHEATRVEGGGFYWGIVV